MASQGPNSVSVGVNNTSIGGSNSWSTPSNIYTSDDQPAQGFFFSGTSNRLVGRGCGFSVPTGSTIDGIEVLIESGLLTGSGTFNIKLWNGTSTTADNSIGTGKTMTPAGSDTVITLGSPTDLWGATLTDTIVNSAAFGACAWFSISGMTAWMIDHVQIKVYYTESGGGGGGGSVSQTCIIMCG